MHPPYVVMYKQYGDWHFTVPFKRLSEMQQHIRLYLDREEKDYITEIKYFELTDELIATMNTHEKQHS